MKLRAIAMVLMACTCMMATAQKYELTDEAEVKAFGDIYDIDTEAFGNDIVQVHNKVHAAFLREYMALMQYTAANSKANYEAYFAASDKAFEAAAGSKYEHNLRCQLHIHKCMVYMYDGSMVSSGIQFWKAYRQFKSGEEKYANYDGQLPFRGIFNVLFSQIPEKWKSLAGFLGFGNGNLKLGFEQIEQYRKKVETLRGVGDEALVFSFANMFFSHDQDLTDKLTEIIKANKTPVVTYAYILSCGRRQMGEEADRVLANVPQETLNRFPLLYHQRAKYALRRLQTDEVLQNAQEFLRVYKGVSNKNDAYLQMCYAYLMTGNRTKAQEMANKSIAIKSDFDIDVRTHAEATRAMNCDTTMLRARFLFEYGKYSEALDVLKRLTPRPQDVTEHNFRLARAYDVLKDKDKAVAYYDKTVATAGNSTRYFGPYAAIYAADIYLERNNKAKAKEYALKAQKLNNGEYKKELDQRIELTLRVAEGKK